MAKAKLKPPEEEIRERPIGILDSGLGGLGIVHELQSRLPQEDLVYFADFAHYPYGLRPLREVETYVLEIVRFFIDSRVKLILLGCNNASAAATVTAQEMAKEVPVIGIIEAAVCATLKRRNISKVGIVGTTGTIDSGAYHREFADLSRGSVTVFGHACDELLDLPGKAEIANKQQVRRLAKACVSPLEIEGIEALLFGCTDFSAIAEEMRAVLDPAIQIVDPIGELASRAIALLREKKWDRQSATDGNTRFFASGQAPEHSQEFALQTFNIHIDGFAVVTPAQACKVKRRRREVQAA